MSKQTSFGLLFIGFLALLAFNISDADITSLNRGRLAFIACSGAVIGGLFVEWIRARNENRNEGASK
jgi:hypothetical protein